MKPTKRRIQTRNDEILRIRLDGAEFWDVCEYVREKEQEAGSRWETKRLLSDSQVRRYIQAADKLIAEAAKGTRTQLLNRHLAIRRNLYAKAVNTDDVGTALAVAKDECALLDLYPKKKPKPLDVNLNGGKPVPITFVERAGDAEPAAAD
jgi:hypothetical protein